ncbi:MAG: O-succinylhomoserine sulfhydrylase [Gammaproteobacteria bacterium]|nr:O-succinylhomoserine sulfhydrylase [Gammaproteobacteria bacterium]MCP5201621.1 O-succinylhomoserine sulfhydrylase [Gammaproteobacteria bacterium]
MNDHIDQPSLATLACRAGSFRTAEMEHSEALFLTSSFCFESAAQAAARFAGEEPGNVYSRFTNPTVRAFEERLAALEGGERAIATASGMSAILSLVMAVLGAGDHVVASRSIFGTSVSLFSNVLPRFGVQASLVDLTDLDAWRAAITPATRMLFLETPSNPLTEVADLEALAALAHEHGAWLVVDNCFCTPALQRPLALGADLVIHSATKFLDGQGRCLGGAIVGPAEIVDKKVFPFLRTAGPSMSPFNAWVFLKGLETLPIRMERHCRNALAIASWLEQRPEVRRVFYPGLASHPQHALAARQQAGFGGIVSFELVDRAAAWHVVDHLRYFSITANLGDAKSIVTHPATTTHGRLSQAERDAMGVSEGLLRLSIGLEDADDLVADLARALHGIA